MSDLESAFERLAVNFRNGTSDQNEWDDAMCTFEQALMSEHDTKVIEKCVALDMNWELPVGNKIDLLNKGKNLGILSKDFVVEYHRYMCAHLDYEDPEKDISCKEFQKLTAEDNTDMETTLSDMGLA